MVATLIRVFGSVSPMMPVRQYSSFALEERQSSWKLSFILVFVFLACASLVAPERPDQLASICERHNAVTACRVM